MKRRDLLKSMSGFSVFPFINWNAFLKNEKTIKLLDYADGSSDQYGAIYRRVLWVKGQYLPCVEKGYKHELYAISSFTLTCMMYSDGSLVVDFYEQVGKTIISNVSNYLDKLPFNIKIVKRYSKSKGYVKYIRYRLPSDSWRVIQEDGYGNTLGYFDKNGFVRGDKDKICESIGVKFV